MHEVGVAQSILETVLKAAKENNALAVSRVGLRIGALSGVEPTSLEFALNCLKADTLASEAQFELEIIAAVGTCAECGGKSTPETYFSVCSHCNSPVLEITAGEEFDIAYIDIDEE